MLCGFLESEAGMIQGTAFHLSGVGLVTCDHVVRSDTQAFKADDHQVRYPVSVQVSNQVIDLAVYVC